MRPNDFGAGSRKAATSAIGRPAVKPTNNRRMTEGRPRYPHASEIIAFHAPTEP